MSDRMSFFNDKSGSQKNSALASNIYGWVLKNNPRIYDKEPRPLEEIWQSKLMMKICEYVKNGNLKF